MFTTRHVYRTNLCFTRRVSRIFFVFSICFGGHPHVMFIALILASHAV